MEVIISIIGAVVAIVSAVFSFNQAKLSQRAVAEARLMHFFGTFDKASEASIANPELLQSVHGLPVEICEAEARSIAYLSLLLDGFQHYYGELYDGDFSRLAQQMKKQSTMLNRLLSLPENQNRWKNIQALYYGDFDNDFVQAIDNLIEHENSKP